MLPASRTTRVRERATFGIGDAVRHGRHVSPRHDRHALTMRPAASAPARFPRPSSPRCRDAVNCRRPCAHYRSTIPEHERRAGDSSNECLPPRRPPAGSRCAPARATNAPRVAPTHAAVKRTETRACFAPARGEPAALPARRSQQDAPPRRPRIRSPVSYRRSRFSALISKISSNRQVITRKMLVLLCGKRLYFRKDYQELLKAAVTHTSTSDRASREPDGFGTRPGDGSGCDEE